MTYDATNTRGGAKLPKKKKEKKNPTACSAWLLRRMQAQPWQTVHAPPPPGEDAVLHRRKRAGGADLAAPSSMVDPWDDVGEGGPTITN